MREPKHLEALVSKAESGLGRGSPSALSVERLNGTMERLVRVRMRVERRVYEGAFFVFFGSYTCLAMMLIFLLRLRRVVDWVKELFFLHCIISMT